MEWLQPLIAFGLMLYDLVMHLDRHSSRAGVAVRRLVYLILFAIIFAETGLRSRPSCRATRCSLRWAHWPR